jgi:hypothetical protein
VFLTNGSADDIEHPEFADVTTREFMVGLDLFRNCLARRSADLDPLSHHPH